jgi:hypothetical protein
MLGKLKQMQRRSTQRRSTHRLRAQDALSKAIAASGRDAVFASAARETRPLQVLAGQSNCAAKEQRP